MYASMPQVYSMFQYLALISGSGGEQMHHGVFGTQPRPVLVKDYYRKGRYEFLKCPASKGCQLYRGASANVSLAVPESRS